MSVNELQETISHLVARPVQLTITDNSHSMISVRSSNRGYRVRLHHMFLEAEAPVLEAVADFIRSRSRNAPPIIRDFVAANSTKIKRSPSRPRRRNLRTAGRFFDLRQVFDRVNREYFQGQVDCAITWGAKRRIRPQKMIRLGTYSEQTKTIHINPVLDRSYVPAYVIHGVVFHEMLHHHLGVGRHGGRAVVHSGMFRQMESRYRHYGRLRDWIEKNRRRLLGRRCVGSGYGSGAATKKRGA